MKSIVIAATLACLLVACSRSEDGSAAVDVASREPAPTPKPAAVELIGPSPMPYEEPMVGGAVMSAGKDIMANILNSRDHTTLVEALKAAGLDETLREPGPITIFAPTNAAFDKLPSGTLDNWLRPENQEQLVKALTYHIVPGRLDADALASRVMAGNGSALLTTVEGQTVKATVGDGMAILIDARGRVAHMSTPNVLQSNGVMHVVDQVLLR